MTGIIFFVLLVAALLSAAVSPWIVLFILADIRQRITNIEDALAAHEPDGGPGETNVLPFTRPAA
jgi:hypothetical protein